MERNDDGSVEQSWPYLTTETVFRIFATNIRREHSGVHARIALMIDSAVLVFSTFNVERDEERLRLANACHKRLPTDGKKGLPADEIKRLLDGFCYRMWQVYQRGLAAEAVAGDAALAPIPFLLEPYIVQESSTLLFGPPERAKSWTALLMAVSLDAGLDRLYPVLQAVPTLYLNLERSKRSFERRLGRVNDGLLLKADRPLLALNARGRSLADVLEVLVAAVRREGIGCVFIDSISRAGYGQLTRDDTANTIMDAINGLGCASVAIGHTPREDDSHVFGSQMFSAAADIEVRARAERRPLLIGVSLEIVKGNDLPIYPPRYWAYEFAEDVGFLTARTAASTEFPELAAASPKSTADLVAAYLGAAGKASPSEIAEEIERSRGVVQEVLKSDRFVRLGREGKAMMYGLRAANTP